MVAGLVFDRVCNSCALAPASRAEAIRGDLVSLASASLLGERSLESVLVDERQGNALPLRRSHGGR